MKRKIVFPHYEIKEINFQFVNGKVLVKRKQPVYEVIKKESKNAKFGEIVLKTKNRHEAEEFIKKQIEAIQKIKSMLNL